MLSWVANDLRDLSTVSLKLDYCLWHFACIQPDHAVWVPHNEQITLRTSEQNVNTQCCPLIAGCYFLDWVSDRLPFPLLFGLQEETRPITSCDRQGLRFGARRHADKWILDTVCKTWLLNETRLPSTHTKSENDAIGGAKRNEFLIRVSSVSDWSTSEPAWLGFLG